MAERFLVIGGGTMGAGIALTAARGGYDVEIVEPDAAARARSADISNAKRSAPATGRRSTHIRLLDAIRIVLGIDRDRSRSGAVRAQERRICAELAAALGPDALLATNTSSLSVADLADLVPHPERVLGLAFFQSGAAMKLVEVVHAPQTGDDAIERAYAFVERIGKTPCSRPTRRALSSIASRGPTTCSRCARSSASVASAGRARRARARGRLPHGTVRADGSHRSRREPRDQRIDLRAHRRRAIRAESRCSANGRARAPRTQDRRAASTTTPTERPNGSNRDGAAAGRSQR